MNINKDGFVFLDFVSKACLDDDNEDLKFVFRIFHDYY